LLLSLAGVALITWGGYRLVPVNATTQGFIYLLLVLLIASTWRLGSEPIAGLALQGAQMPDSVVQGIANLVAIGLERARAQDLAAQIEVAQQTEKLRTALIDAMAHELKTPLTSIMAATTAFLDDANKPPEDKTELVRIADEETKHLKDLIDESVHAMRSEIEARPIEFGSGGRPATIAVDQRLLKLAIKQLVDNALKYSPPETPLKIDVRDGNGVVTRASTRRWPPINAGT
jgi:two-component system sensor histidine kinase KdpD